MTFKSVQRGDTAHVHSTWEPYNFVLKINVEFIKGLSIVVNLLPGNTGREGKYLHSIGGETKTQRVPRLGTTFWEQEPTF